MHAVQGTDQAVMRRSADLKLEADILAGTVTATFIGQEALIRRLRTWVMSGSFFPNATRSRGGGGLRFVRKL